MSTKLVSRKANALEEIVQAVRRLNRSQLDQLRKKLDAIEHERWTKQRAKVADSLKRRNIKERDIDEMIMRKRYEGRA